jgi:hypothetical protein
MSLYICVNVCVFPSQATNTNRETSSSQTTKNKDVPAATDSPQKKLSKRRLAILHNTRNRDKNGIEPATSTTPTTDHVPVLPMTIRETQDGNGSEESDDDSDKAKSVVDDNETPAKQAGLLKRDLSTPSSASQDSYGETSR